MTILIVVAVVLLVLFMGGFLAWLFTRVDGLVTGTKLGMVTEQQAYNPAVTMGHEIKVSADYTTQMQEARLEAARSAASTPRGANFGIGSLGNVLTETASKALGDDPMTAVRIARYHGWDGARSGPPVGGAPVAGAAPAAVAALSASGEIEVVAGRDYQEIAITDAMSPEDVRKARVANAKARSAALKTAKAAQASGGGAVAAPAAAAGTTAAATVSPMAAGIAQPALIEITDAMAPEDIRKARVANAKAQAAYNKALKAAGGAVGTATVVAAEAAAPVAAAVSTPVQSIGIAPPVLIEITDAMAPEDVRKARVANAKTQAAYNKALKAAGIDPSAASAPAAPVAQAAPAPVAEMSPAAAPASGTAVESLGIPKPQLTEITDAMSPEDVRRARVDNAKAMSAYNKALKAAGIDPATVK